MHSVIFVKPLQDYYLEITFDDNKRFKFDVSPFLYGQVFEPLRNKRLFRKVNIDPILGSIYWPTGADFCPDFLYKEMKKRLKKRIMRTSQLTI